MNNGANPIDGSSNNSNFGLAIKALAMATICCSPPDKVAASWFKRSLMIGKYSNDFSISSFKPSRSLRV